jgi:hypothetical protein
MATINAQHSKFLRDKKVEEFILPHSFCSAMFTSANLLKITPLDSPGKKYYLKKNETKK